MGWDTRKLINAVRWGLALVIPILPFVPAIAFLKSEGAWELGIASTIFLAFLTSGAASIVALLYVIPGANAFHRGRTAFLNGDSEKAFKFISRAVHARDNFHTARTLYASLLIPKHQAQEALIELDKVIAAKKKFMPAYYSRALAKNVLGDHDGAMADINQAIRLKPRFAEAYAYRADIFRNKKDFQQAINEAHKSIRLKSVNSFACFALGRTFNDMGNYQAAVGAFNSAVTYEPKNGEYIYFRGHALRRMGDYQAALKDIERALELLQNDPKVHFERGYIKLKLEDYATAWKDFDTAFRLEPKDYGALINRGCACFLLDDFENAKADFEQALAIKENGHSYINLGNIHLLQGESAEAIAEFQKGRELLSPDIKEAVVGLVLGHYLQGEVDKAREYWAGLVNDEPRFQEVEWVVEEHGQHPKMAALIRRFFADTGSESNSPATRPMSSE